MDVPRYLSSKEIVIPLSVETLQSANIDEYIQKELNNRFTGLHNGEGIVLPGTIKILYRSSPQLDTMNFGGGMRVFTRYVADIVDAPPGSSFVCKVVSILQTGILASVHPSDTTSPLLRVYIPMTIHSERDQDRISTLRVNDLIRVLTINRRGSIGDKTITVLASFVDLVEKGRQDEKEATKVVNDQVTKDSLPSPEDEEVYDAKGDGDKVEPTMKAQDE
jgi:hypothetical protein